jgi:hypothetical protein
LLLQIFPAASRITAAVSPCPAAVSMYRDLKFGTPGLRHRVFKGIYKVKIDFKLCFKSFQSNGEGGFAERHRIATTGRNIRSWASKG